MRPSFVAAAMLVALAVPAAAARPAAAGSPAGRSDGPVAVTVDPSRVNAVLGDRFTVRAQLTNVGGAPTDRLIAHLNVASLTSDVYVDPEDWSSSRTLDVAPLGPGGGTSREWELQAVNVGSFDVYVVLLPVGAAAGSGPLVVSPPVHVTVAGRQTLNAGGALPVVIAVPVLLGLAVALARYRLRRTA
ncbi:MAG TPA: hypothetical protein VLJ59_11610 [Mycobacteriales bacterium]|nr:hypothetical protein [Mycobacteriales bacterium]